LRFWLATVDVADGVLAVIQKQAEHVSRGVQDELDRH
jgi:hypothetical protein